MVLILLVLVLSIIGLVRIAKPLELGQRVVLVLAFIAAVVYLALKLMQLGILGRATTQP